MPARSSASLIATPPRSAAEKSFSEPSSRPIGVRAPLTMTERDMGTSTTGRRAGVSRAGRAGGAASASAQDRTAGGPGGRLDAGRDSRHTEVSSQTSLREDAPVTTPDAGLPADLFTTIDHVGIAVPDLREAIAFYELAFGITS